MLTVSVLTEREDKLCVMKTCDDAFEESIVQQEKFAEYFEKLENHAVFFKAAVEGETAGFLAAYMNQQVFSYVTLLGVRPRYRRCHVGKALMNFFLEECKSRNYSLIRLEVRKNNDRAQFFYKSCGFVFEQNASDDSVYLIKNI